MYYTLNGLNNYIFTHRALRICFIVFLILAIIFVGFATQVHAFAPALLPALYVVVAAALGAAGVTFATNDEAQAAAANFLESLSESDAASWTALATEYSSSIAEGSFVSHLSNLAISNIASWIGNLFNAETGTIDISGGNGTFLGPLDIGSYIYPTLQTSWTVPNSHPASNYLPITSTSTLLNYVFPFQNGSITQARFLLTDGVVSLQVSSDSGPFHNQSSSVGNIGLFLFPVSWMPDSYLVSVLNYDSGERCFGYMLKTALNTVSISTSLQADTTFFPNEVIDSAPTTTFPANTATQALTTDIPLNIPASLDDVVTNTGALRGELTNTNTLLGTISAGIAAIGAAITSFFDTSQFQLDFEPLKIGLTSVFPFCIPFDFVRMVRTVAVNSSGFSFDIDLHTDYFDLDHTVDLTPFRIPILFFRFICDFWFCFILISRTRDWIKW